MPRFGPILAIVMAFVVCVVSVQLELLSTANQHSYLLHNNRWKTWMHTTPFALSSLVNLAALGTDSGFRPANGFVLTNAKGSQRIRLIQTYGGYDVFGSSVEAEMDINGYFTGEMYGRVARDLRKDILNPHACMMSVKDLQKIVLQFERNPPDLNVQNISVSRLIYLDSRSHRGHIAYRIHFLYKHKNIFSFPVYILDACTASVLLHFDGLMSNNYDSLPALTKGDGPMNNLNYHGYNLATINNSLCDAPAVGVGGNIKTGLKTYNAPPYCLNVQKINETVCEMTGNYSTVIDYRFSPLAAIQFNCIDGYEDGVNGAYGVASEVFYYAEFFGRFFQEKYNLRILPDISYYYVHFGDDYGNAFYDFEDFYFGDGHILFYPLTTRDVVVHETAHAVTVHNSGLLYREQSGGIHESFSDITSEVVKHFETGKTNWLFAWGVTRRMEALRIFDNPSLDGKSIDNTIYFQPGMNVHGSSGVFNHAFYRLVEKEGMDIYDAYKCFLDANLMLWTPYTKFREGACQVMQACYDNGFDHKKVRRAFFHVGIWLFTCDYDALTTSLSVGESRKNILVRNSRSPIIKVKTGLLSKKTFVLKAGSEELEKIHIVVGTDKAVRNVITAGDNTVNVGHLYSYVYVKLISGSQTDIRVTLETSYRYD